MATEERLHAALVRHTRVAIAVSGGVDSMTLAHVAHDALPGAAMMVHAVSPAVPAEATARVRRHAEARGWDLRVVDAGEFDDATYRANPVNRCYYCKSHLYDRIRAVAPDVPIASGANVDDLGDYRPGLVAAAERAVVHPYLEAGLDKAAVRALARELELHDLSELPAQPCLSSRVETGIRIEADDLAFIHRMERRLAPLVDEGVTVRCRITRDGVMIELAQVAMHRAPAVAAIAAEFCDASDRRYAGMRPYRQGAAFLRPATGT